MDRIIRPTVSVPRYRDDLYKLIQSLEDNAIFDFTVESFEIVETHISYILLTGPYAYKFKKPIDLGFLDFSTLEKRKRYCEEELRLNCRHASELYLEVVAITGEADKPMINGDGPVLEYAVKMVQFDRSQELDKLIYKKGLSPLLIDQLAQRIAAFHDKAQVAGDEDVHSTLETVFDPMSENFHQISARIHDDKIYHERLKVLEDWSCVEFETLKPVVNSRKTQGFIRECHGDMHLGNIVLINGAPVIFDCIEFSQALRWIDVISDIAFLVMDLLYHQQSDLAYRLLNAYLQETGDYAGLSVLRFYLVYRAMVRAKVACIRMGQEPDGEQELAEYRRYIDMAGGFTKQPATVLFLMHGVSGTGKTIVSQLLLESWEAIRIRSDVERKRLKYFPTATKTGYPIDSDIYSTAGIDKNYIRLQGLATLILHAGFSVIVDATFLRKSTRRDFMRLAAASGVPVVIFDCRANIEKLKERVRQRWQDGKDASEADLSVLAYQMETQEYLDEEEKQHTVVIDTDDGLKMNVILAAIKNKLKSRGENRLR